MMESSNRSGSQLRSRGTSNNRDLQEDTKNLEALVVHRKNGSAINENEQSSSKVFLASLPNDELRLVFQIGRAAVKYGAASFTAEAFVLRLLQKFGYEATVSISFADLTICIFDTVNHASGDQKDTLESKENDARDEEILMEKHEAITLGSITLPFNITMPVSAGTNLTKLSLLSDLAADILQLEATCSKLDVESAQQRLDDMERLPPTCSKGIAFISYILTSFAFATILRGGWGDAWASLIGGGLAWTSVELLSKVWARPERSFTYGKFVVAFLPAVFSTSIQITHDLNVHPATVIVASVVGHLPGVAVTVGTFELAKNKLLSGLGRWISALLVSIWLSLGAICGVALVARIADDDPDSEDLIGSIIDPVNEWYSFLMAPLLATSFSILFQVRITDMPYSVGVGIVSFVVHYFVDQYVTNANVATILAAFTTTLVAQLWGNRLPWKLWHAALRSTATNDPNLRPRPSSIVLFPAFFILMGGSLGVRALSSLLEGDSQDGTQTLGEFLLVPLLLVLGIYLGASVVPSQAVL